MGALNVYPLCLSRSLFSVAGRIWAVYIKTVLELVCTSAVNAVTSLPTDLMKFRKHGIGNTENRLYL